MASVNGSSRRTEFGCSQKERLLKLQSACSRTIQTPALTRLCAGRITVDAREKD